MTRRIGGSAGSPKGSVQSSTPFASIMRSASFAPPLRNAASLYRASRRSFSLPGFAGTAGLAGGRRCRPRHHDIRRSQGLRQLGHELPLDVSPRGSPLRRWLSTSLGVSLGDFAEKSFNRLEDTSTGWNRPARGLSGRLGSESGEAEDPMTSRRVVPSGGGSLDPKVAIYQRLFACFRAPNCTEVEKMSARRGLAGRPKQAPCQNPPRRLPASGALSSIPNRRRRLLRTNTGAAGVGGYPAMGQSVVTSSSRPTLLSLHDFSTPPVSQPEGRWFTTSITRKARDPSGVRQKSLYPPTLLAGPGIVSVSGGDVSRRHYSALADV